MNLNDLRNFAPNVRRQLIEAVGRKLDFVLTGDTPDLREKAKQRLSIKGKAETDRPGLVERVAYTWFNRLAALRFLDARGWHPFLCRVLTPANKGETQPEILKLTRNGALPAELSSFTDFVRINDLLDGRIPSADPQGEVYRHLVLAACRYYHNLMPFLFEALDDETELLLPDDLLTEHSIAQGFRSEITDGDCAEVEIIGWLYQYYITEKKDQVMARKSAVPTEDIPAVTQLFTPHWIVRYLVENSLGRLWLLNRPGSRLREHMPYYIEGEPETDFLKINKPEEIRLLDPASGSGHMLTYSFDLLYLIYEEEGHAPGEITGLILRHNLFGLEICPRATQLAQFALVCKAREKSRLAFRNPIQPQVMCLENVELSPEEMTDYLRLPGLRELFTEKVLRQIHQFRENTSTFGSLIRPVLTAEELTTLKTLLATVSPGDDLLLQETHSRVHRALDQAEMLSQRYHVVVANPPYIGGKQMTKKLKGYAKESYPQSKSDLFAMFMERGFSLVQSGGYNAMITMQSWMFLSSFEDLRIDILTKRSIRTMAHLGARAFDSIGGEVVQTTAFVAANIPALQEKGTYFRLTEGRSEREKATDCFETISNPACGRFFRVAASDFMKIPGSPIAYWAPDILRQLFADAPKLSSLGRALTGLQTGDTERFLKRWYEVPFTNIGFSLTNNDAASSDYKWFPCNKGGGFRKWYGNQEYVIDWHNNGQNIKNRKATDLQAGVITANNSRCWNESSYFQQGIGWSLVTSGLASFRFFPKGTVFDINGPTFFTPPQYMHGSLAFLNSSVVNYLAAMLTPTLSFSPGIVTQFPIVPSCSLYKEDTISVNALRIAQTDWDNFETSWDFRNLPLLRTGEGKIESGQPCGALKGRTLAESWTNWKAHCDAAIRRMQALETENNRLWIDAYGLQDELTSEVREDEITLARADQRKDVAAFLSYTIGCMMGRYSLDRPGLILANAGDTLENYLHHVSKQRHILDLRTALAEPLSVVLQEDASPKCFCCGKVNRVSDAWFILADIYDRTEGQICGRPMVYCKECLKEKEGKISLSRRLCDFSLAEAIDKKWAEPDTLSMFLELAGCFEKRMPAHPDDLTFVPDNDGIIPVLDGEWFEDDIVARTRDFLRATFGESTLEENLRFIEESLGKDLRKYFLTDFYRDHLQTYKKRPIYWLFQSPKKGFCALIYLHRYNRDSVNVLLNSYLRDYLQKLRSRIQHLEHVQATSENAREKTAARKESDALKKTLHECEEYERGIILPLAQQRIELDLDDGVKVNYLKFGKALAPIPGLAATEEDG